MKKLILTLIAFILLDGMIRSIDFTYAMSHGELKEFFRLLVGYTLYFAILKSWLFYIPVTLIYVFIVSFTPLRKAIYIILGSMVAITFYLIYVDRLSTFEFSHYRFLTRIIQYSLFGGLFGLTYYQCRIKMSDEM